uniref:Uncharacterized protein n=1 Tax=Anopheles coluzzii TaxID=1518534 RepID=A0A8W7PXD0_ANOCL
MHELKPSEAAAIQLDAAQLLPKRKQRMTMEKKGAEEVLRGRGALVLSLFGDRSQSSISKEGTSKAYLASH